MDQRIYDTDFHAWALDQAERLRALNASGAAVPVDPRLDLDLVAEEIEDVAASDRHAVLSYARRLFEHGLKVALRPDDPAVPHWRGEIRVFQAEIAEHYTPSMHQRLAPRLSRVWTTARQATADRLVLGHLPGPETCPLTLDQLVAGPPEDLIAAMQASCAAS